MDDFITIIKKDGTRSLIHKNRIYSVNETDNISCKIVLDNGEVISCKESYSDIIIKMKHIPNQIGFNSMASIYPEDYEVIYGGPEGKTK